MLRKALSFLAQHSVVLLAVMMLTNPMGSGGCG